MPSPGPGGSQSSLAGMVVSWLTSQFRTGPKQQPKKGAPIARTIRFDLVDKDCPVFAAMPRQISLTVSINVQPSCHASALNRRFPDGGVDGFPLPLNVAWQAHIY